MLRLKKFTAVLLISALTAVCAGCSMNSSQQTSGQTVENAQANPPVSENNRSNEVQNDEEENVSQSEEVKSICPNSSTNYLTACTMSSLKTEYGDSIQGVALNQMLINEIYARHGYKFKNQDLQNYFTEAGYKNLTKTDAEVQQELKEVEKQNIKYLKNYKNSQYTGDAAEKTENYSEEEGGLTAEDIEIEESLYEYSSNDYMDENSVKIAKTKAGTSKICGLCIDQMLINEIYARHGCKFKDAKLQKYFYNKKSFTNKNKSKQQVEQELTDVEKANIKFLQEYHKGHCK